MALMLRDGDYVSDGKGGLRTVSGSEEVLDRVLWKLTVRRGSFPFLPELGSRLHLLGQVPAGRRETLARQYAAEALSDEELTVTGVSLSEEEGRTRLAVRMDWKGKTLTASVRLEGMA